MLLLLLLCLFHVASCALVGKGSTLLCPLMRGWKESYLADYGVEISYDCTGSGVGKQALMAGEVDFAATDSLFSDENFAQYPGLEIVPDIVAPIAVVVNIPGIGAINLKREVVSKIFMGEITLWDDYRIVATNPLVALPAEAIKVVVRTDSSGTTEIMTRGLQSFGFGWRWGIVSLWPAEHTFAERREGSSGVLDYVRSTPYSIGYNGVSGALEAHLSFASIVNKAGRVTIPGWPDAATAAAGMVLDETHLTATMADGQGYPLTGVSYLAYRTDKKSSLCAVLRFLEWVATSPVARSVISSNSLVPLSVKSRNLILARLRASVEPDEEHGFAGCKDEKTVNVNASVLGGSSLSTFAHTVGYAYHEANKEAVVHVTSVDSEDDGDLVTRLDDSKGSDAQKADAKTHIPFPVAVGLLAVGCNFGLLIPSVELDLDTVKGIFQLTVVNWNSEEIRGVNRYIPNANLPIKLVSDTDGMWLAKLLEILFGWKRSVAYAYITTLVDSGQLVLFNTIDDMAFYIKSTPGAIGVLPHADSVSWELSVVSPVVGGTPRSPMLDAFATVMSAAAFLNGLEEVNRTYLEAAAVYPLFYIVYIELRSDLTGCNGAVPLAVQFISWIIGFEDANGKDGLSDLGLYPLTTVLREALHDNVQRVRCDGELVFKKSDNMLAIYLGISAGVVGVIIGICLSVMWWKWRVQRVAFQNLYGANVLAMETAEAVASLDFDVLEKLKRLENPDRIQTALLTIMNMMQEFVKFIPQHVIKSVRSGGNHPDHGVEPDDAERSCASHSTSEEDSIEDTVDSTTPSRTSRRGFKQLSGKAIRVVGAVVVRPPVIQSAVKSLEEMHSEFLHWVLSIAEHDAKSTVHRVCEDSVVIAWGILGGDTGRYRVCKTACKLSSDGMAHCGIKIGMAFCGSLGSENIKTFQILGGLLEEAEALARVAQLTGGQCLASYADDMWGSSYYDHAKFFKVVSMVGNGKWIDTCLLFPNDEDTTLNKEWMYSLQEKQDSAEYDPVRQALSLAFDSRDLPQALNVITNYVNDDGTACKVALWLRSALQAILPSTPPGELPPPIEPGACGSMYTVTGIKLSACPSDYIRPCPIMSPDTTAHLGSVKEASLDCRMQVGRRQ
eukprot:TRINITY_DN4252_c3_g2_i1.p1 TRINITY_DN4252_c3_g2~~TRINITY_DN4252_c3_g2_i1.p1  ORF type:complete len:1121 (+),score=277.10 TRINITY_DN4252_c3_g2_i1:293-3655(+)